MRPEQVGNTKCNNTGDCAKGGGLAVRLYAVGY